MKVTVCFNNLTMEEARAVIGAASGVSTVHLSAPSVREVAEEEQLQKPRRRRRTKAEMKEVRAEEQLECQTAEEQEAEAEVEPKRRRRRRPAAVAEENTTEEGKKRRRRRGTVIPEDDPPKRRRRSTANKEPDEITDRDVSKAASEGAQELTPAAVRGILDQFGVANVGDLDQSQRCEFIDMVDQAIVDAGLDVDG